MRLGGTVVVMEQFDPEHALALIEQLPRHAQPVGADDVRAHAEAARRRARDATTCRRSSVAIHAAAPCPVEVKRKMIEWWGPIIDEYYAATEGMGATYINSAEWLAHPGSVGRRCSAPIHILDDDGNELPAGEIGTRLVRAAASRPASSTTRTRRRPRDAFNDRRAGRRVGDMGYLDDDGYLYLTDRRTFMIVSGGVNIYPQEAENLLDRPPEGLRRRGVRRPQRRDGRRGARRSCSRSTGATPAPSSSAELLAYCRDTSRTTSARGRSTSTRELPREPTGKLYKRLLRDRYWGDRTSRIV